jgi:hypothetical protein
MVVTPKGTPTGTTYRWTFSDLNPSFALSGYSSNDTLLQPSITQTLLNSSNNIVNANYLITTSTNGCLGKPFQLKAIVNPTPTVKITGASTVCANGFDTLGLSFTGTGPWAISYIDNKDNLLTQISGFSSANSFIVQQNLPIAANYVYSIKHVNDAFCKVADCVNKGSDSVIATSKNFGAASIADTLVFANSLCCLSHLCIIDGCIECDLARLAITQPGIAAAFNILAFRSA